ncbi:unnamed protein product, partial [Lepidochelys olivacea]
MDNQKTLLFAAKFCFPDQTTVCRKASVADVVFLVDGSWSIGKENFRRMQDFLYIMVSSFDVGEDKIRIGLIQYSDAPHTEFFLSTYNCKEAILEKIQALHYKGGGTKTGESLRFMLENHFEETVGSRRQEGVPQIAVVITDGQAQDNIQEPAKEVKDTGITLYAIGIKDASLEELREIASDPDDKHVYEVEDFTDLQDISHNMLQVLCSTVEEVNQITHFSQVCTKATLADIVFLVPTSTSIGPENFQKVKNFLYILFSSLNVSSDQIQVGRAQYSNETFKVFLLNQYSLKSDILEQIQNLPYKSGGSYTGTALDFVRTTYFTESAGSRALENVPQSQIKAFTKHYADIIFLVDSSVNMRSFTFEQIKNFIYQIVDQLDVGTDKYRVGLAQYSREGHVEFLLNTYKSKEDMLNHIQGRVTFLGGPLQTGSALEFLHKVFFKEEAGSRISQGTPQFAVVITSAKSKDDVAEAAEELKEIGVKVISVGVQNSDWEEMEVIATSPLVYQVNGVQGISQLHQDITDVLELSVQQQYDSTLDAKVPADIVFLVDESSRIGLRNFQLTRTFLLKIVNALDIGPNNIRVGLVLYNDEPRLEFTLDTQKGCVDTEEADIYFLMDGSGSIFPNDFQDMKVFMNELIRTFQVSANGVRFGVVQYASTPQTELVISQYDSVNQVKVAVRVIHQSGAGTNTGDALRYMKSLFAKATRDNVPKMLIVITDGESQDQVTKAAEELRQEGIVIYAIGIRYAVKKELKDIAGTEERMFFVNDFDSLKLIKHDIVQDICSPEACKNMKADIILLVDSSESIHPVDFQKMKDFIQLIVNRSDIGADKVQIGLLQFSSEPHDEFQLNSYSSKTDLRRAISGIRQIKSGTMTGKALTFSSSYFDEPKGGRPRVKQYLIVITDGEAQDIVREPAETIRDKGITIYAIGVLQANNSQLVEIAGSQDKVFFEDNYDSLTFLEKDILFEICNPED